MKYSVETKEVILRNCKITFDYEVVKVEEYENILIILTKNTISGDVQKQPFNNIIAIDENANVVWRISELTNVDIFYSGFYFNNIDGVGKVLEARDCKGIVYTIRLSDFTLIKKEGFRF